jgi:hypothetical protein
MRTDVVSIDSRNCATCPEHDPLLVKLIALLEDCASVRNCEQCLKLKTCRQIWDRIAEEKGHDHLTAREYQTYHEMLNFIINQCVMFN